MADVPVAVVKSIPPKKDWRADHVCAEEVESAAVEVDTATPFIVIDPEALNVPEANSPVPERKNSEMFERELEPAVVQ